LKLVGCRRTLKIRSRKIKKSLAGTMPYLNSAKSSVIFDRHSRAQKGYSKKDLQQKTCL
jgi:hypothetical protein